MDFSKKLILKITFNGDIRRLPVHNEDLTYNELFLMLQRIFKEKKIGSEEELLIKYSDIDGDLVTIVDDSDLLFAIQECQGLLKLTVDYKKYDKYLKDYDNSNEDLKKKLHELKIAINNIIGVLSCSGNVIRDKIDYISEKDMEKREINGNVMKKCEDLNPLAKKMDIESTNINPVTVLPTNEESSLISAPPAAPSVAQLELNTSGHGFDESIKTTNTSQTEQQPPISVSEQYKQPTMVSMAFNNAQTVIPSFPPNYNVQHQSIPPHFARQQGMNEAVTMPHSSATMIPRFYPSMAMGLPPGPPMAMPPAFGGGSSGEMSFGRPPAHHFRPQHMPPYFQPTPQQQGQPPQQTQMPPTQPQQQQN